MPQEVFEVGDRVLMTPSQHLGTIAYVRFETPRNAPGAPNVRRYDIKLDDGNILQGVYRGIERAVQR